MQFESAYINSLQMQLTIDVGVNNHAVARIKIKQVWFRAQARG